MNQRRSSCVLDCASHPLSTNILLLTVRCGETDFDPFSSKSFDPRRYSFPSSRVISLKGVPGCRSTHCTWHLSRSAAIPLVFMWTGLTWLETPSKKWTKYPASPNDRILISAKLDCTTYQALNSRWLCDFIVQYVIVPCRQSEHSGGVRCFTRLMPRTALFGVLHFITLRLAGARLAYHK